MTEHLLLEKAYIYPASKEKPELKGCQFDAIKGYWIVENTREPYVSSNMSKSCGTKKCDMETGEDQKGE